MTMRLVPGLTREQLIDAAVAVTLPEGEMRHALVVGRVPGRQEALIAGHYHTLRSDEPRARRILSRIYKR